VPGNAVLVIDAGTSAMRAVLVAANGVTTTLAREPYRMFTPSDGSAFTRELDGDDLEASLGRLLAAATPHAEAIAGIALTGQREGLAFVDDGGRAALLSPNVDGRAAFEGMTIDREHGERVYATTGHLPSLMLAPAKLAWLRANRPAVAERVRRVMPLADWLGHLLTGEFAVSRSLAAEVGCIDIASGQVARDLLATLGTDPGLLPPVIDDGALSGTCGRAPLEGAPVVLAGADTQCALVGMGRVTEGAGIAGGWSAPLQRVASAYARDERGHMWSGLHVAPGAWVRESNAGECGRAWDWARSLMGLSHDDAAALVEASPPGARDALACLGPPRMNASAMNAGTGALSVPLPLVMSQPERGDILRSVLEAIAFAIRANLEQLEGGRDGPVARLGLGGGMSALPPFARIVCDAVGRPLDVAASPETSAAGAAAVASPALKLHDTIAAAARDYTRGVRCLEPNARASAVYDDCYVRWSAMAGVLEQGMA
jgi:autoinducer 2 (AI-2) kinase